MPTKPPFLNPGPGTTPRASVVIAAYNAEAYIGATLESVLRQDFSDFEITLVDDGSTDRTAEIVRERSDSRVRLVSIANSGGPSRPRNIGIEASRGEFVFIFDADDLMLPGKLRCSIELLENTPEAGFLFSNFQAIDEHGALVEEDYLSSYETLYRLPFLELGKRARLIRSPDLLRGLSAANFIGTSSVALRRDVINQTGVFDQRLKAAEDYDYWVRVALRFNGIFVDYPLHQYRRAPGSISRSNSEKRLNSQLTLHEKQAKSTCLPDSFRARSRQKGSVRACQLARFYLKVGASRRARGYALRAVRARPQKMLAYCYYLLSWIPAWMTTSVVRLRDRFRHVS